MAHWCIIRDHELLRKLISSRMEEKNITARELSRKTGVNKDQISGYLTSKRNMYPTQWGVVKIANELGIEVKLDLSLTSPLLAPTSL